MQIAEILSRVPATILVLIVGAAAIKVVKSFIGRAAV